MKAATRAQNNKSVDRVDVGGQSMRRRGALGELELLSVRTTIFNELFFLVSWCLCGYSFQTKHNIAVEQ